MITSNTLADTRDRSLVTLMRDHGYRYVADGTLISCGVRGYTSDRMVPRVFRGAMDAAEYLIPVICDDMFSARYRQITKPTD